MEPADNHIKQRINDNHTDIPLFFGEKALSTVTGAAYIDRIKQGTTSLTWTPADAFSYFKNSIWGRANDWLIDIRSDNKKLAQTWTSSNLCSGRLLTTKW